MSRMAPVPDIAVASLLMGALATLMVADYGAAMVTPIHTVLIITFL